MIDIKAICEKWEDVAEKVVANGSAVGAAHIDEALFDIARLVAAYMVVRDETIEACAVAAEAQDRTGREWVKDSLWDAILRRAGENVRKLKQVRA